MSVNCCCCRSLESVAIVIGSGTTRTLCVDIGHCARVLVRTRSQSTRIDRYRAAGRAPILLESAAADSSDQLHAQLARDRLN